MSQLDELITTLKQQLKAQGITYAELASQLQLSEANIKRMFSKGDFSLSRLEQIAACMQISLADLFELMAQKRQLLSQFSHQQEQQLVNDETLLLVALCCINQWNYQEILEYYQLDQHQLTQKLAQLDRMKIIEMQPGDRIKLLVGSDFDWLPNGPIQQFFQNSLQANFFNSRFDASDEVFLVRTGMLSPQDNHLLQQKLKATATEFIQACNSSKDLPLNKRHGTIMLIAMRPWVPSLFKQYER